MIDMNYTLFYLIITSSKIVRYKLPELLSVCMVGLGVTIVVVVVVGIVVAEYEGIELPLGTYITYI